MINDHLSGIGSSCFWNPGDVYGQKGSCKADSKVKSVRATLLQKANQRSENASQQWTSSPLRFLFWATLFAGARSQLASPFPASIELSSLDGTNGFVINGENAHPLSGRSVSAAGDVNGDGIEDIVIGAPEADPSGKKDAGKSYVVFGTRSVISGGVLELANLNGTKGFTINGEAAGDQCGYSVSTAGDVNADNIDENLIGAYLAAPSNKSKAGKSYVVFGSSSVVSGGVFELANLDGTNGFTINGEVSGDASGHSVSSAGDVNADGIDDILIGAERATPPGRTRAGKSYVIFGSRSVVTGGTLELANLDGTSGFSIYGEDTNSLSGNSVSSAGDINSDGIDDTIIGAPGLSSIS